MKEIAFRVGGAAGDGVASTAETFARLCVRGGLWVHTYSSYQSVIRGGHVWTQVRAGTEPVLSQGEEPDVLIILNQETADIHVPLVRDGGAIVYDEQLSKLDGLRARPTVRLVKLSMLATARQLGEPMMKNVVALGAALALLDIPFDPMEKAIREVFGHKKPEIVEMNLKAGHTGYDAIANDGGSLGRDLPYGQSPGRMMMTGNEAMALGALAAGVKFHAQYPMTPASGILHWLAANGPKHGVVVKQAEDELAAMNMAVGAGHEVRGRERSGEVRERQHICSCGSAWRRRAGGAKKWQSCSLTSIDSSSSTTPLAIRAATSSFRKSPGS